MDGRTVCEVTCTETSCRGSSLPAIAEVLAGMPRGPKSLTSIAALDETGTAPRCPGRPSVRPHSISSICNLNLTGPPSLVLTQALWSWPSCNLIVLP